MTKKRAERRMRRSIFSSLYWRISAIFLVLLLVLSAIYIYVAAFTAEMYFQEASQRLNSTVAAQIASDITPFVDGKVNTESLEQVFHNVMVINPSIEVYLLDTTGRILSYYAPNKTMQHDRISMDPIQEFIRTEGKSFVMGMDPKKEEGEKVFSAAAIEKDGKLQGYIYVILEGEEYESSTSFLLGSYILRIGTRTVFITLAAAILIGLLAIRSITKNVRTIRNTMQEFKSGNVDARIHMPGKGELTDLAESFNHMADTITQNMEEIKTLDTLRRELVANVSHDLRTPLAIIQGYVETVLMKDDSLDPGDKMRYLSTVLSSTERLRKLVEELFELSKLEAKQTKPKLELFSIAELVQDVAQKFDVLARQKNITVRTVLPHDLPPVNADIALIERVLQNLVDNALKFTPESGTITIALSKSDVGVNVEIIDSGEGISPEDLPHVFERYTQGGKDLASLEEGTGLGLAIVKKILEAHGVTISVKSAIREGTAFSFQLPVTT
ncbi:HAMP domain-containing histidine kinase [bacterium]|nr:HAMP domain-containing histidine kinase [bacterium]